LLIFIIPILHYNLIKYISSWTCAIGLKILTRAVVENSGVPNPCAAILDGECGLDGSSRLAPVQVNSRNTTTQEVVPNGKVDENLKGLVSEIDNIGRSGGAGPIVDAIR
jgi:hypothetical protein